MKYIPVELEENVNVDNSSQLSNMFILLGKIILLAIFVYISLGLLVDLIIPFIPPKYETKFSGYFVKGMALKYGIDTKHDRKKVQNILDKLVHNMDSKNKIDYKIHLLKSEYPNALAFLGGDIVVFSSLINKIDSENELAMVLGHELGHYVHRDHLSGLGRNLLFIIGTTLILGGDSGIANMVSKVGNSIDNKYSRNQEMAADLYGLELLNKTYGHVGGAVDFFEKLDKENNNKNYLAFFSTHPFPKARVKRLKEIIKKRNYIIGDLIPYKKK